MTEVLLAIGLLTIFYIVGRYFLGEPEVHYSHSHHKSHNMDRLDSDLFGDEE